MFMATHKGINTGKLARGVGRNYKNVYIDVNALAGLGSLFTAPFDEILIHAAPRDVA